MVSSPTVVISVKGVELEDEVREALDKGCRALAEEFREATHYEVTLSQDGDGHSAHARVTGKNTEVAGHAEAEEARQAATRLLQTLEKQLRRAHDKRIFGRRREAQRNPPKRGGS